MYYIYMLRCGDGTIYTGITTDIRRRFSEHMGAGGKGAKYTAAHGAVRIEAAWSAESRSAASKLEYRIKRLSRGEKERLIREETTLNELFSGLLAPDSFTAVAAIDIQG